MNVKYSIISDFINHFSTAITFISCDSNLAEVIREKEKEKFTIIDLKNVYSPVKPFFDILKKASISSEIIDEIVYPLQKKIFTDYFSKGVCCERDDVIFDQEYQYEKSRLKKATVELLKRVKIGNYIFLNSQFLFKESLDIIDELQNSEFDGKMVFCFDSVNYDLVSKHCQKFIENIAGQQNFLKIPVPESEILLLNQQRRNYADTYIFTPYASLNSFDEIISSLRSLRLTLSSEEAINFCNWISSYIRQFNFTNVQDSQIELEIAKNLFDNNCLDEALIHLNKVTYKNLNNHEELVAYYYMSKVFAKKKTNQMAYKYAVLIKEKLSNQKKSSLYALALNMEYHVTLQKDDFTAKVRYEETTKLLLECGLLNNFVITSLNIPWTIIDDRDNQNYLTELIEKILVIAKKIDNQHLISSIWHRKAIILSHYGFRDEALVYNQKCNQIRTEIGEIQPILAIRNGISYELLNISEYVDSYETINEILPNIYSLNDYSTIIDSLKNITYSVFFTRHFDMAEEMFDLIIYFLNIFNLKNAANNSYLPSTNDLLLYKSMLCIEHEDYVHAKMNYIELSTNGKRMASYDKPFLHYLNAACLIDDEKFDESEQAFKDGFNEFCTECPSQSHKTAFMYFQYAKLLFKKGEKLLGKKYLLEAFEFAKKHNLKYYTKGKNSVSIDDYINGAEPISPLKISLPFLKEKGEKDHLMNQLHNKIYEYQFLNQIKSFNGVTLDVKKYLEKALLTIFEYSMARSICVAEKKDGKWKKIHNINRDEPLKFSSSMWNQLYKNSDPNVQLNYNFDEKLYFANISKYDFEFGILIVPASEQFYSYDQLNIMNIALSYLQSEIIMLKQKENLMNMSFTDQLSLLKNRRALQDHIILESERIRRIGARKNIHLIETVCFMDLDNFKFYNDTFGHQSGDLIIQEFAKLLKRTLRCVDFIARYGGDEFVLILPDTNIDEAFRAGERIRDALKKSEYFIPKLKKLLDVNKLDIPSKNLIGFSMGLCCNTDLENKYDLDEALKNADSALYYSKEHGKCMTSNWAEVK